MQIHRKSIREYFKVDEQMFLSLYTRNIRCYDYICQYQTFFFFFFRLFNFEIYKLLRLNGDRI